MKLRLALEDKLMDSRLRDRLVAEGKISKKDVDQYLNSLPEEDSSSYEKVTDKEEQGE
tara:strand:- start:2939 stop:3112 length:174 start_codon:yes stop_codon:yes gene_type:complete